MKRPIDGRRSAEERDEWRAAGAVATDALDRAVLALAFARRRSEHAAAEGIRR